MMTRRADVGDELPGMAVLCKSAVNQWAFDTGRLLLRRACRRAGRCAVLPVFIYDARGVHLKAALRSLGRWESHNSMRSSSLFLADTSAFRIPCPLAAGTFHAKRGPRRWEDAASAHVPL